MEHKILIGNNEYRFVTLYEKELGFYIIVDGNQAVDEYVSLTDDYKVICGNDYKSYLFDNYLILCSKDKLLDVSSYRLDNISESFMKFNKFADILGAINELITGNYVVSNVQDYITAIEKITTTYEDEEVFFRGHYNYTYDLIPSLYRKKKYYDNENYMYMDFKNQFYKELANKKYIEILTTMQHYKMPTRLLDTTSNPLVALYMACDKPVKYVGISNFSEVVVMHENHKDVKYSDSNSVTLMSALAVLETPLKQELYEKAKETIEKNDLSILRASLAYKRFVAEIHHELPYFDESFFTPDVLMRPRHVKVGMINERIVAQSGGFIIFGLVDYKTGQYVKLDNISDRRIFVTNRKKILKQLEMLNITQATMYPDKDHMSVTITKSYD